MRSQDARAYWVESPASGALRATSFSVDPALSLLRTRYSAISCGTERLVGRGNVSDVYNSTMGVPNMEGSFSLPIKYGYALVGTSIDDGAPYFTMHPHQEYVQVEPQCLISLQETPLVNGALFPFFETALNAIWDSRITLGEEALVIGAGGIGAALCTILTRHCGIHVTLLELSEKKMQRLRNFGLIETGFTEANNIPANSFDVVFNASGNARGLQSAIDAAGYEGRIVELTWHGDHPFDLAFNTHFHRLRKTIISSQVGTIPSHLASRINRDRRNQLVLNLLAKKDAACLITRTISFTDMPEYMVGLYENQHDDIITLVEY